MLERLGTYTSSRVHGRLWADSAPLLGEVYLHGLLRLRSRPGTRQLKAFKRETMETAGALESKVALVTGAGSGIGTSALAIAPTGRTRRSV